MEILNRKEPGDSEPTGIFHCTKCKSELKAKTSDGKYVADWRDGDYYEIKCPVCKAMNNVSAELFR